MVRTIHRNRVIIACILASLPEAVAGQDPTIAETPISIVSPAGGIDPGDPLSHCPSPGSCCEAEGGRGCSDRLCCQIVCTAFESCCTRSWSTTCRDLARAMCDVSACSLSGCPGSIGCCQAHESRGCNDEACCAAVCGRRRSCCSSAWTQECAVIAETTCPEVCSLGPVCGSGGDCCRANSTAGCADEACCALVCDLDPYCCATQWDSDCAVRANELCSVDDEVPYCQWCEVEGGCCEPRLSPGCNRAACCEQVCAKMPTCCTSAWRSQCADMALDLCLPTACQCETFGDVEPDGDIDLADFARFALCFTGLAGGPVDEECACADSNGDGSVDPVDLGVFVQVLLGPQ